jgi:hypothetical protein
MASVQDNKIVLKVGYKCFTTLVNFMLHGIGLVELDNINL